MLNRILLLLLLLIIHRQVLLCTITNKGMRNFYGFLYTRETLLARCIGAAPAGGAGVVSLTWLVRPYKTHYTFTFRSLFRQASKNAIMVYHVPHSLVSTLRL